MLYLVACHITMLYTCHKPYNGKNNVLLMSNNQRSIGVTVAYVLDHATGTGL